MKIVSNDQKFSSTTYKIIEKSEIEDNEERKVQRMNIMKQKEDNEGK